MQNLQCYDGILIINQLNFSMTMQYEIMTINSYQLRDHVRGAARMNLQRRQLTGRDVDCERDEDLSALSLEALFRKINQWRRHS